MNRSHQENYKIVSSRSRFVRSRPRRRKYRLGALSYRSLAARVLLVILATGVCLVVNAERTDSMPGEVAPKSTFVVASKITATANLLDAYLNVIGGRDALEDIRSVRMEGQVSFDNGDFSFLMILLAPDKGMLVMMPDKGERIKLMLNGDTAWRVLDREDGRREYELLDGEQTQNLKWSLQVHNTFRRIALGNEAEGLLMGDIEYRGRPCYELTKTMPDGSEFLAVLDKESLYLLKTRERLGSEVFTVVFSGHHVVSGIVEPYKTKLYRGEDLDSEMTVKAIRHNAGFISPIFKIPDELKGNAPVVPD